MRRTGGLAPLLRQLRAAEGLQQLRALSGVGLEQAAAQSSSGRAAAAAGVLAAAGGAAALAYSFSAAPVVAHAEAPPSQAAITLAPNGKVHVPPPPEDPYTLPAPSALGTLPREVVLYQYEVCPFCCKVKAFLDYHKIPYRCVEVNPLTKAELSWSDYKKVPVVMIDGTPAVDSSAIISRLAAQLRSAGGKQQQHSSGGGGSGGSGWWPFGKGAAAAAAAAPAGTAGSAAQEEEEARWRRWVDEWFVRVVTVNIYRSGREAWQTFNYIAEHGNFGVVQREAARVVGAGMMWGLSGRLKKKYKVEGDVRECLYKSANEWVDALGGRPFMGGDAPNLADLAVFGVCRSVVGTDTFTDLMLTSRIGPWYERMFGAVGDTSRLS